MRLFKADKCLERHEYFKDHFKSYMFCGTPNKNTPIYNNFHIFFVNFRHFLSFSAIGVKEILLEFDNSILHSLYYIVFNITNFSIFLTKLKIFNFFNSVVIIQVFPAPGTRKPLLGFGNRVLKFLDGPWNSCQLEISKILAGF